MKNSHKIFYIYLCFQGYFNETWLQFRLQGYRAPYRMFFMKCHIFLIFTIFLPPYLRNPTFLLVYQIKSEIHFRLMCIN